MGWWDIARRVWCELGNDHVTFVAAAVAFYFIGALVPALSAFVAMFGLFYDASAVVASLDYAAPFLPDNTLALIRDQLVRLTSEPNQALSLALVFSIAIAWWSSSAGCRALMEALNIIYEEQETRSWLHRTALALAFTIAGMASGLCLTALAILTPSILGDGIQTRYPVALTIAGYAVVLIVIWGWIVALYRWGPSRADAKLRWLAPGSLIAVGVITAVSLLFAWYAKKFALYSSYGSLGAVLGFLLWSWLNVVLFLVGAEINAETEHQTAIDTTTGAALPMGLRGATMADTVGAGGDSWSDPESRLTPGDEDDRAMLFVFAGGLLLGLIVGRR